MNPEKRKYKQMSVQLMNIIIYRTKMSMKLFALNRKLIKIYLLIAIIYSILYPDILSLEDNK